jgi:signal transduction histidine kinase
MENRKIIHSLLPQQHEILIAAALFLVFIIAVESMVFVMAKDYKATLISHDREVAGYLANNGVEESLVAGAFGAAKTSADTASGTTLLNGAGYSEQTKNSLLPLVAAFQEKYALIALSISCLFAFCILALLYFRQQRRNRELEDATQTINRFMEGDTSARLYDGGETSRDRFFAAVNTLVTSLTAHIEKERHNKIFLKDTISDISHQLKTPLAALQMYNEIIANEKTGNEVVEGFTEKSQRELERMETLIQSLLKLARLDAGTITLDKKILPLHDFLNQCVAAFATRAQMEGKTIVLQCNAQVALCLDAMWMREAVGNIIKNALDHTKSNDQIEIICEESAVDTEIVIRDNGMGIHPEDIHHIFKRFYRSRFSKDQQGVGIGLPLAKAIIEKHGGVLTVESSLGEGSSFHLVFPKTYKTVS